MPKPWGEAHPLDFCSRRCLKEGQRAQSLFWGPALPQPGVLCSAMEGRGCGQGPQSTHHWAWSAASPALSLYT